MRQIFRDPALEMAFRHHGYVIVPFFSPDEVQEIWKTFENRVYQAPGGFHASMYTDDYPYRQQVFEYLRPRAEPKLDRLVIDYRVLISNFMVKPAHDEAGLLPVHLDWSFVDEPENIAVHVWAPLVDTSPENGCLAVVAGSHHLADPPRAHADEIPFRAVMPMLEREYLLEIPMRAGTAILYDGRLLHGSRVNRTDQPRVAVSCMAVPRGAPVHHMVRINPRQVEKFAVESEFYWTYELFSRPQGVPSLGLLDYSVQQITEQQIRECPYMEPVPESQPLA